MKITMNDLNELILISCAELNNLASYIMDNKIEEDLKAEQSKEKTWYEFVKFKEKVEDYKFSLELFNKNKEWNLEHQFTRSGLDKTIDAREYAEIAVFNIERVLQKTKYLEFKDDLKESVNLLIASINGYLTIIKNFLESKVSELEYKNLLKNYNLENLNKLK